MLVIGFVVNLSSLILVIYKTLVHHYRVSSYAIKKVFNE
jgi:hypothetical protein